MSEEALKSLTSKRGAIKRKLTSINVFLTHSNEIKSDSNSFATQMQYSRPNSFAKLPEIPLPKFNGLKNEWLRYKENFVAIIHDNPTIPTIVKFQYLTKSLGEGPEKHIKNIAFTADNYQIAWETILSRYDNPRMIVETHIAALINLKNITNESSKELRDLLDDVLINVNALEQLQQPFIGASEMFLIHLVTMRLDKETRKYWELQLPVKTLPTWAALKSFLLNRCQLLETMEECGNSVDSSSMSIRNTRPQYTRQNNVKTLISSASIHNRNEYKCEHCQANHLLFQCSAFRNLTVNDRYEKVKSLNLCLNCLRSGHGFSSCNSRKCKLCDKPHHSLLHFDKPLSTPQNAVTSEQTSMCASSNQSRKMVFLATVIINVQDINGSTHSVRALLDSASTANYVTEKLSEKLKIQKQPRRTPISGINNQRSVTKFIQSHLVQSRNQQYQEQLDFLIIPEITDYLPNTFVDASSWPIPQDILLADPDFCRPKPIEMLIGAEAYSKIVRGDTIDLGDNYPSLQQSAFGWIVLGKYVDNFTFVLSSQNTTFHIHSTNDNVITNEQLSRKLEHFFSVEESPAASRKSKDEIIAEEHFSRTVTRNNEGRYIVKLPYNEDLIQRLGDSYQTAQRRFEQLERRFVKNPELKCQYVDFMRDYIVSGHMEASNVEANKSEYYIPHHCVFKPDSKTTKIRVVFDASAKSSTGVSLNDALIVGAMEQQDLFTIILRARKYSIMFTADIKQMYRQVLVADEHRHLQKILWRESSDEAVRVYQLNTITYGTSNAPSLATRTLTQVGIDNVSAFPNASKVIMEDFYVDDLISGHNDINAALELQRQVTQLLNESGMKLHKWASNHESMLEHLDPQVRGMQSIVEFNETDVIKTLGIAWNPQSDKFHFKVPKLTPINTTITKRHVASEIASLYDPLGLLGPIIVIGKMIMQNLWKVKIDWDDSLPQNIYDEWRQYQHELPEINNIAVERCVMNHPTHDNVQLHGFADASKKAYGAAVYIRTQNQYEAHELKLLCSKSRVAPLKHMDITRLELSAAVLLAKLVDKVIESMQTQFQRVVLWSDSTIVLNWLQKEPCRLPTFIANRVAEIQTKTEHCEWRHIPSAENSADVLSRGELPSLLKSNQLWWFGPDIICQPESQWPSNDFLLHERDIPELKAVTMLSTSTRFELFGKISSYRKLQRIIAYMLRFINGCRKSNERHATHIVKTVELQEATLYLVKLTQREYYHKEIIELNDKDSIVKGELHNLDPFLDSNNVIRIGGRLRHADLPYNKKHPFLLPSKCTLAMLIIKAYHEEHGHASQQLLLSILREEFWIPNGRATIKGVIRKCTTCFHHKPIEISQPMGQLPIRRVTQAHAFESTGVDYAGPINIRVGHKRSKTTQKGYIALFICFVTKATHIELISDLTTPAFLAGLYRFLHRRGNCSNLYSDNGTTFVGANNELKQLNTLFQNDAHIEAVNNICAKRGISWHFIPPRAPNFGGLWEAGIKSMKTHLKKLQNGSLLNYEELLTILIQVEGLLNSRPITPISNDPNDFTALTPAHFLTGRAITAIAEPNVIEIPINRLTKWKQLQQTKQHIWKRWHQEYLSELQTRKKWSKHAVDIKEDMLVLIKEDNVPPMTWRLARIMKLHKGIDGVVRVVDLRTPSGEVKRPITKICPLPFYDADDEAI